MIASDVLPPLAPVSLAELAARADALARTERKYLIPLAQLPAALSRLDPRSHVLDVDGRREFAYESVYFDTPDHLSYLLCARGRRRRFKLRTRTYLDAGTAFLEMKSAGARGATLKERMPYDPADRARITPDGAEFVADLLRAHGQDRSVVLALRPGVTARYRRATILLPTDARVTVDTQLRWIGPDGRRLEAPRHAIVETKCAGAASEFDRALWRQGVRPRRISKFGAATAALHPELPRTRWARLLRDPFILRGPFIAAAAERPLAAARPDPGGPA